MLAAFFTLLAILLQANLLNNQIKAERASFIQSQRPKITARTFYLKPQDGTQGAGLRTGFPVGGQFYIANPGGTTAAVKEVLCVCRVLRSLPAKRPWEGLSGTKENLTIKPGLSSPYTFASDWILEEATYKQLLSKYMTFYIMGWIDYDDESNIRRTTRFCRRYDTHDGRFWPVENDPDYESQD